MQPKRKRLFFDIETSPNIGLFWRPGYNINLTHENIIKERAIICIGYKWENERKAHCLTWDKDQNDKEMLKSFISIMNEADEVVGHNSNKFDITWIRTRCIRHGIPMIPNYTSLDTFSIAKGRFNFNSNQLDYIGKFLGLGGKKKTEYELWKKVLLDNDKKSLKTMVDYCKRDVILLEKVWELMNPYVLPRTSIAEYANDCPECGSDNVIVAKKRATAAGYKKVQFQCKDCGKYHTIAQSRFEKGKKL